MLPDLLIDNNYTKVLRKANTLELKKPTTALLLLNDIYEYISNNEDAFLEVYPTRKFDVKNMGSRIGRVQKKIQKMISTKDGAKKTIGDQIKNADTLAKENKYDKAENQLKSAGKIAKDNDLEEEMALVKDKSKEVAAKKEVYEADFKELNDLIASAEECNTPAQYTQYIEQCQNVIASANEKNHPDIAKKYAAAVEATQQKVDGFAQMKVDIDELRKQAKNNLEEGKLPGTCQEFAKITQKLEEYLA